MSREIFVVLATWGTCTFDGDDATSVYACSTPTFDEASAQGDRANVVHGTFSP